MKKFIVVMLVGSMSVGLLTGCGFSVGTEVPLSEVVDTIVGEEEQVEPTVVEVGTERTIEEAEVEVESTVVESEVEDIDEELMNDIANDVLTASILAEGDYDLSAYAADVIGSYNGVNFSSYGSDIQTLFDDDWYWYEYPDDFAEKYINEDETTSLTLINDKYDDASFLVQVSYSLARKPKDEYIADLTENGFFGYQVDCANQGDAPDMTFNGLTWGASVEDVKAAYGAEPDYTYEGTVYTMLEYDLTEDVTIDLYVYGNSSGEEYKYTYKQGLQKVDVDIWNINDMLSE